MLDIEPLLVALTRAGLAGAVPSVRVGVRGGGLPIAVEIEGDPGDCVVVRRAREGEGPPGALVAVVTRKGRARRVIRANVSASPDRLHRRSVRLSDATWDALSEHGDPSEVARVAIAAWLEGRRR